MTTEESETVTLSDAEGNETTFIFLGVVEVDGDDYALLTPANEDENAEATEIFIFRYEQDEDGAVYADVEDEETFDKVRAHAEELFATMTEGEENLDA